MDAEDGKAGHLSRLLRCKIGPVIPPESPIYAQAAAKAAKVPQLALHRINDSSTEAQQQQAAASSPGRSQSLQRSSTLTSRSLSSPTVPLAAAPTPFSALSARHSHGHHRMLDASGPGSRSLSGRQQQQPQFTPAGYRLPVTDGRGAGEAGDSAAAASPRPASARASDAHRQLALLMSVGSAPSSPRGRPSTARPANAPARHLVAGPPAAPQPPSPQLPHQQHQQRPASARPGSLSNNMLAPAVAPDNVIANIVAQVSARKAAVAYATGMAGGGGGLNSPRTSAEYSSPAAAATLGSPRERRMSGGAQAQAQYHHGLLATGAGGAGVEAPGGGPYSPRGRTSSAFSQRPATASTPRSSAASVGSAAAAAAWGSYGLPSSPRPGSAAPSPRPSSAFAASSGAAAAAAAVATGGATLVLQQWLQERAFTGGFAGDSGVGGKAPRVPRLALPLGGDGDGDEDPSALAAAATLSGSPPTTASRTDASGALSLSASGAPPDSGGRPSTGRGVKFSDAPGEGGSGAALAGPSSPPGAEGGLLLQRSQSMRSGGLARSGSMSASSAAAAAAAAAAGEGAAAAEGGEAGTAAPGGPAAEASGADGGGVPATPRMPGDAPANNKVLQLGVSVALLAELAKRVGVTCSTAEAWERYLSVPCQASQCRFLDLALGHVPFTMGIGPPLTPDRWWTGPPNYYVIHAWEANFHCLVQGLVSYFEAQGGRAGAGGLQGAYVWLDVLALNHHPGRRDPKELVRYKEMLPRCKKALVVMDASAAVLSRLWCMYEMHMAAAGAPDASPERLAVVLADVDWHSCADQFWRMDLFKAVPSVPHDRVRLLEEVARSIKGGCPGVSYAPDGSPQPVDLGAAREALNAASLAIRAALEQGALAELAAHKRMPSGRAAVLAAEAAALMLATAGHHVEAEEKLARALSAMPGVGLNEGRPSAAGVVAPSGLSSIGLAADDVLLSAGGAGGGGGTPRGGAGGGGRVAFQVVDAAPFLAESDEDAEDDDDDGPGSGGGGGSPRAASPSRGPRSMLQRQTSRRLLSALGALDEAADMPDVPAGSFRPASALGAAASSAAAPSGGGRRLAATASRIQSASAALAVLSAEDSVGGGASGGGGVSWADDERNRSPSPLKGEASGALGSGAPNNASNRSPGRLMHAVSVSRHRSPRREASALGPPGGSGGSAVGTGLGLDGWRSRPSAAAALCRLMQEHQRPQALAMALPAALNSVQGIKWVEPGQHDDKDGAGKDAGGKAGAGKGGPAKSAGSKSGGGGGGSGFSSVSVGTLLAKPHELWQHRPHWAAESARAVSPAGAVALLTLADILATSAPPRREEACQLVGIAAAARVARLGANHTATLRARYAYAASLAGVGLSREALALAQAAQMDAAAEHGDMSAPNGCGLCAVARVYCIQNNHDTGHQWAQRGASVLRTVLGNHHPLTLDALQLSADILEGAQELTRAVGVMKEVCDGRGAPGGLRASLASPGALEPLNRLLHLRALVALEQKAAAEDAGTAGRLGLSGLLRSMALMEKAMRGALNATPGCAYLKDDLVALLNALNKKMEAAAIQAGKVTFGPQAYSPENEKPSARARPGGR